MQRTTRALRWSEMKGRRIVEVSWRLRDLSSLRSFSCGLYFAVLKNLKLEMSFAPQLSLSPSKASCLPLMR